MSLAIRKLDSHLCEIATKEIQDAIDSAGMSQSYKTPETRQKSSRTPRNMMNTLSGLNKINYNTCIILLTTHTVY